jgi:putative DNA methylase
MIPKDCKRLAEVDFPIAVVSKHAAREKSIRHGHPSTLHLWWARRPLASSRAVLLGLLWPDPCDPLCPAEFKERAQELLPRVQGAVGRTDGDLRKALLKFIGDFANWDLAANRSYLEVSRALVKAAHLPVGRQAAYEPPLVVDPFAGGGSIPLEALRLGCEAFASDLNPVACLILKVMLEDIPRHEPELAEELRLVGSEIKRQAEEELAELYPKDPNGATPIAYLWARTVRCESPNCGAEIPLARSLWLCKKANRRRALKHRVVRPAGEPPSVEFEVFEPKTDKDVPGGTVTRAKATCVCCGAVLPPERVRAQLTAQRGGADVVFDAKGRRMGGARMLAVVTLRPSEQGRHYRLPSEQDYEGARNAQERLAAILTEWERGGKQGVCPVPDEPINPIRPSPNARGLSAVTRYGMACFGDVFTSRQTVGLVMLVKQLRSPLGDTCRPLLACALSRVAMSDMSCTRWNAVAEKMQHTFGRQALPMIWDFAEVVVTADAPGNWRSGYELIADVIAASQSDGAGHIQLADAAEHPLPDETAPVWFTDPPYYDAIPYADLSDFFLVWLKRVLPNDSLLSDPFDKSNALSPKERESVWNRAYSYQGRPKDNAFYEEAMARAFAEGRRVLSQDGIGSVVFAHKTTEGWEALLSGMIRGGWTITGSWPIATEMGSRLNARETASLSTSVHLICRPRSDDAGVGDWAGVLRELPNRVGDWMERLQSEGVRGADLVFACIGPALEIFSRYAKVETADGRDVALAEYLEKVWEVVGRSALAQVLGTAEAKARNGAAGAVEEDARLTALFLWTLQSTTPSTALGAGGETEDAASDDGEEEEPSDGDDEEGSSRGKAKGFTLVFDVVRRFAQPLGIELPKWEGRVIETKKGVVRLLPIAERARQLFGEDGAQAVAARLEEDAAIGLRPQLTLFPDDRPAAPAIRGSGRGRARRAGIEVSDENLAADRDLPAASRGAAQAGATTLDRVHAAMLLQAGGRTNALRALLKAEQERGPDFLRLANALSALYPKGSEEKRLLDAMLLAVPR